MIDAIADAKLDLAEVLQAAGKHAGAPAGDRRGGRRSTGRSGISSAWRERRSCSSRPSRPPDGSPKPVAVLFRTPVSGRASNRVSRRENMLGRFLRRFGGAVALVALAIAVVGALAASATPANNYSVTNLVSDQEGKALTLDKSLVNAWGLAAQPTSPWWVADNGTDVSTLYRADGSKVPLTVGVRAAPTGLVANGTTSFVVSHGQASGPRCSSSRRRPARFAAGIRTSPRPSLWSPQTVPRTARSTRGWRSPRRQRQLALRDRLPQRVASTSSTARSSASRLPALRRSGAAGRVTPRSGSRTSAGRSSSPTRSRMRIARTRSPASTSASSTCTTRAGSCSVTSRAGVG